MKLSKSALEKFKLYFEELHEKRDIKFKDNPVDTTVPTRFSDRLVNIYRLGQKAIATAWAFISELIDHYEKK